MKQSYCRFENTDRAFGDCADQVEELYHGEADHKTEDDECEHAVRLLRRAAELLGLVADRSRVLLSKGAEDPISDLVYTLQTREGRAALASELQQLGEAL